MEMVRICILQAWTSCYKLRIHQVKIDVLFGSQQRLSSVERFNLYLSHRIIKKVQHYKYLGVIIDAHLNFNEHVDKILIKVSKRIGALGKIRGNLTVGAANKVYQSIVLPVLDYCDVAWSITGTTVCDKLDHVQRRYVKIVLATTDDEAEKNLKWQH